MSYEASVLEKFRLVGSMPAVSSRENASRAPVRQPTKFELVLNLETAKALSLSIPEPFLLFADEVIE